MTGTDDRQSHPTPTYCIDFDDELVCETHWPVLAEAAWHRVSRNRSAARCNTQAQLRRGGQLLARTYPSTQAPPGWPDPHMPAANWHDVVKKILQLVRRWDHGPREVADAMTQVGLPTSRSRIDALRGNTRRVVVIPAELVVLLDSIIAQTEKQTKTYHAD